MCVCVCVDALLLVIGLGPKMACHGDGLIFSLFAFPNTTSLLGSFLSFFLSLSHTLFSPPSSQCHPNETVTVASLPEKDPNTRNPKVIATIARSAEQRQKHAQVKQVIALF